MYILISLPVQKNRVHRFPPWNLMSSSFPFPNYFFLCFSFRFCFHCTFHLHIFLTLFSQHLYQKLECGCLLWCINSHICKNHTNMVHPHPLPEMGTEDEKDEGCEKSWKRGTVISRPGRTMEYSCHVLVVEKSWNICIMSTSWKTPGIFMSCQHSGKVLECSCHVNIMEKSWNIHVKSMSWKSPGIFVSCECHGKVLEF